MGRLYTGLNNVKIGFIVIFFNYIKYIRRFLYDKYYIFVTTHPPKKQEKHLTGFQVKK